GRYRVGRWPWLAHVGHAYAIGGVQGEPDVARVDVASVGHPGSVGHRAIGVFDFRPFEGDGELGRADLGSDGVRPGFAPFFRINGRPGRVASRLGGLQGGDELARVAGCEVIDVELELLVTRDRLDSLVECVFDGQLSRVAGPFVGNVVLVLERLAEIRLL